MQPFSLIRPTQLARAQAIVREDPERREFRAGGIDLLDRMKEGLDEPEVLVELRSIEHDWLRGIERSATTPLLDAESDQPSEAPEYLRVGAMSTLAEIAQALGTAEAPGGVQALQSAASQAATPGIRNTATLGGNLLQRPRCWYFRDRELLCLKKGGSVCLAVMGDHRSHAILGGGPSFIVHPSSTAVTLLALDASALIQRASPPAKGELEHRLVKMSKLFALPSVDPTREHTLGPGEVLISLHVPLIEGARSAYQAVREKQSHDWPLVEAAARLRLDGEGKMREVRVALGHVAPIPWLAPEAAELLEGQRPELELFARAAQAALSDAAPLAGNAHKVPMTIGLVREVLHRASGLPLPE